ncbi:MAG TPA: phosphate/phosphite/phosphonate ABC transporter substrate-binding protein [bacterium]|nr:phosphate/phosphite/phosphonate ABC transporter substrate-binding protein [bacterium]
MTVRRISTLAVIAAVVIALLTAGAAVAPAQTKLVMAFVPSGEARTVLESGNRIAELLGTATGYQFESFVATSYAGVIEAMGAGRADIGWLNTFSYVIAHQKYGVEVRLVTVRFGLPYYRAEIITQASSGINSLADLKGKRFAFVDPASTSGYLFPLAGLKKAGYDPSKFFGQTVFAGSHNNVVLAVYQGRVDGGAVFEDARGTVQKDYPDVMQKTKVIWKSDPIPNDTVSFRKGLPAEVKDRVANALLRFSETQAGLDALKSLYEIEALADYDLLVSKYHVKTPSLDAFYNPVRDVATYAGVNLEDLIKPQ